MVYDRTHTRELDELGRCSLVRMLPFAAVTFIVRRARLDGFGPGFSGFVARTAGACRGMADVSNARVALRVWRARWRGLHLAAVQQAFFGADGSTGPIADGQRPGGDEEMEMGDGRWEIGKWHFARGTYRSGLLVLCSLVVGLYPRLLLDVIAPALDGKLFDGLRKVVLPG